MRFYAISFRDMRDLPIRTFWKLNEMIDRVRAEEILDWLPAHASAMGGEGVKDLVTALQNRVGQPVIFEQVTMDQESRSKLERMFGS